MFCKYLNDNTSPTTCVKVEIDEYKRQDLYPVQITISMAEMCWSYTKSGTIQVTGLKERKTMRTFFDSHENY